MEKSMENEMDTYDLLYIHICMSIYIYMYTHYVP